MQSKQRNQQFMGLGLNNTLIKYNGTYSANVEVSVAVSEHSANMDEITAWHLKQEATKSIRGLSKNKNVLKEIIILQLIKFIGCIKAFGAKTGQWDISGSVDYAESELRGMSFTNFTKAARNVHDVAVAHNATLIPFGIMAADITLLNTDAHNFEISYTAIKALRAESKMATANLSLACKKMMKHLKFSLDNLVKQYVGSPFYTAYFNSRKIYNYTIETTGLRGKITDSSNGAIIKQGLLELVMTGITEPLAINSRGEYHRKKLELNNCILRIRVPHYLPAEYAVSLKKDATTVFDILMTPEPVTPVTADSNNNTVAAQ